MCHVYLSYHLAVGLQKRAAHLWLCRAVNFLSVKIASSRPRPCHFSRLVFPLLQYRRVNPGRARFRRRFRRLPLSCGGLVGPGGDGEPRVRRAECILANRLVLGTLVLAPPMTAIRHGRELCLPGDDVEARSTSVGSRTPTRGGVNRRFKI